MSSFLSHYYGDAEGPLGIPLKDKQAKILDSVLRSLPNDKFHEPAHLTIEKATPELVVGERADVSWITTEDVDRMREIVRADGMRDDHFSLNPLVTLQHAYWLPPVGRSVWRKRMRNNNVSGIKAKTVYPTRPDEWTSTEQWPPDFAFMLVQNGLLRGKSIGFLPLRARSPTEEEIRANPELENVWRIVEEWMLLEYACVFLPAQQQAVVEAVSKGLDIPPKFQNAMRCDLSEKHVSFTSMNEIEKHVQRCVDNMNLEELAAKTFEDAWDRARGRI